MPGSPIQKVLAWVAPVRDKKDGPESGVESLPIRRSARIPLSIPIIISAKDDLGRTFKETTRTLEVSKNGAKIVTSHRLALHADIAIANPAAGRTCLAKVTWRGPRRAKDPIEIGIELLESFQPERIWGLESPPADWSRGPSTPTADQRLQYLCARDRTRPAEFEMPVSPETPEVLPTPVRAPDVPLAQPRLESRQPDHELPETAEVFNMGPAQVSERLGIVADALVPLMRPEIEKSVEEMTSQITGRLARNLDEQAETISRSAEDAVNSLRAAASDAVAKLEAIEATFANRAHDYQTTLTETTASGVEELRQKSAALVQDVQSRLATASLGLEHEGATEIAERFRQMTAEFEERSVRHLEQLAAATSEKLGAELKTSGAQIVNEARTQLFKVTQALVGSVTQEAEAASEECHQQLVQAFEEHAQAVTGSAQETVGAVGLSKQEALSELQSVQHELKASLEGRAVEYQQRLAELAASGVGELEGKSEALLQGFQGQLQSTLETFQERGTKEVAERLEKIAAELQAHSAEYLEHQSAATVERLSQELRASGATVVGETEQQLAKLSQTSVESLVEQTKATAEEYRKRLIEAFKERSRRVEGSTQAAVDSVQGAQDEAAARLEQLRQQMDAGLQASVGEYEKRLADLATSGVGELEHKSEALREGFQGQLQSTLETFQERGTKEVADRLEKIAAELQGHSADYLEQQAAATVERLSQELRVSGATVVGETEQQLAKLSQGSVESLVEQTRATAEEYRNRLLATFEEQARSVEGSTRSAVESVRGAQDEAAARLEQLRQQMEGGLQASVGQYEKRLAELATSGVGELEQKSDALREGFQTQLQSTLETFQERGTKEVAERLEKIAAELQAHSAEYLEQQSAATVERLSQELTASGKGIAEEARQQLASLTEASLGSLTQQADAISGRAHEAVVSVQGAAEEAVAKLDATQQKTAASFELGAQEHERRLAALTSSGMEGLEHKSDILREELAKQSAQLARNFQAQAEAALESTAKAASSVQLAAEGAEAKLQATRQQMEGDLETAAQVHRQRLAGLATSSVEGIQRQSETLLGQFEKHRAELAQTFQEQTRAVSTGADAAAGVVRLATDQAMARLESSQRKIESSLDAWADDHQKQLTQLLASGAEKLEQQSSALAQSVEGRLEQTFQGLQQKGAQETADHLRDMAVELEQHAAGVIEQRTTATLQELNQKLLASGTTMMDEARKELASVTQMSLESVTWATAKECRSQLERIFREQSETVSGAANEAVKSIQVAAEQTLAKLQTVGQKMEVGFEGHASRHQQQLSELAMASSEALQRTSSALLDGFQGRLKNSLQTFEEKSGKELLGVLQKMAADAQEQSAQQLRAHAAETERKLKEGLTASGVSVVEEASRLAGITHSALETLSQTAAEECRKSLDEFKRKSDAMRRQVGQVADANLEQVERDLTPAQPRKSRRTLVATVAIFLALVAPGLTGVYLSTRPVMRLRAEPPAEFVAVNPSWNAKRRAAEEQLARAYWDAAAQNVQPIYRFGTELPEAPPAAFTVEAGAAASTGVKVDVVGGQMRYWQKLRAVWNKPDAWEEAYGWHTDWVDSVSMYLQEAVVSLRWKLGGRLQK